jgi:hypothetical protein
MKSIHFNQVPDMRGKKTMKFTDVTVFNAREKLNERLDWKLAQMEIPELVWDPIYDMWNEDYEDVYDTWYDWEKMYDD